MEISPHSARVKVCAIICLGCTLSFARIFVEFIQITIKTVSDLLCLGEQYFMVNSTTFQSVR